MDVNGETRRLMRLPLQMKSGVLWCPHDLRRTLSKKINSRADRLRELPVPIGTDLRSASAISGVGATTGLGAIAVTSHNAYGYLKIERNAARVGRRSASPLWCHASVAIQCDKIRGCLPAIVSSVAAAIAVGSAPRSIFFGPGLVYIQRPSVHVPAVQRVDGSLPLAVISHLHESKPSRPSGVPVGYDVYAANRPKFLKEGSNGAFGCIEAEVSYKNILHLFFFLQLAEQRMRAG
jgi:hypothetical protein